MKTLSSIEQLVLNAASDDFENLEHIYRSISLEFSSKNFKPTDPKSFYWREAPNAPPLGVVADAVQKLTIEGLLEARAESGAAINPRGDSKFVWQAWFHATKEATERLRGANNDS
jgi:hypothetical protein